MLSRLFQQLFASVGVAFRTIRAFFARTLNGTVARVKSATSLTRQAAKLAPAMMKTAAAAGKKPTKREDYIETKQMFISKSFLIMALVVVIALAVLFYLLVWPWLVSQFFTAKMWYEDPDATDYSGKVILYYEQEKEAVRFEGRLEEGVIQGKGSFFDENGLLVYTGDYVNGVYHGDGTLYIDGALAYRGAFAEGLYSGKGNAYGPAEALVYEGYFAAGLYDGEGRLYGPGEALIYDGSFANGIYDGKGKLYDSAEELIYEGSFVSGLRDGEGITYEDGKRRYKGLFENDLYNGEGVLYDKHGAVLYEGGFLDGLYDGEGVLSMEDGVTIEATFQAGEVLGTARCLRNGKLYYEGDLVNLLPEGTGTLYGRTGKTLYTGPMKGGAVDGGALLGLTVEKVREMLQGRLTETADDRGFSVSSEDLGLTVFCSYAQDEVGPTVYYAYLHQGSSVSELLWKTAADFELAFSEPKPEEAGTMPAVLPAGLAVELGETPYYQTYRAEGYVVSLWSTAEDAPVLLAEWKLEQELPEGGREPIASAGSAGRLEDLLAQLGLSQTNGGSGEQAAGNPYYGGQDLTNLLVAANQEDRLSVVMAALSYFECAEHRVAAEENLTLCQTLLGEERTLADRGSGDAAHISQLEDMVNRLEVESMKYVVQMRKDSRTIEDATSLAVKDFDLQALSVLFDVTALDATALGEEAVAVAMEAALAAVETLSEDSEPAEPPTEITDSADDENTGEDRPASDDLDEVGDEAKSEEDQPDIEPVDREAILRSVEDSLLDLELSFQAVNLALREYETAAEAAAQLEQAYAMGGTSNRERLEAQMTANELRAAFYTATADFVRRAAELNEITGGMLAKEVGWMPELLGN